MSAAAVNVVTAIQFSFITALSAGIVGLVFATFVNLRLLTNERKARSPRVLAARVALHAAAMSGDLQIFTTATVSAAHNQTASWAADTSTIVSGRNLAAIFARRPFRALIEGPAGAGKSTLIAMMASRLADDYLNDAADSLPLILRASHWGAAERFEDWVMREAWQQYQVSRTSMRDLLNTSHVVLFLDGLDESLDPRGMASSMKIWLTERPNLNVVATCRSAVSQELRTFLVAFSWITIEPLDDMQIEEFLRQQNLPSEQLIAQLRSNPQLMGKVRRPSALQQLVGAYGSATRSSVPLANTATEVLLIDALGSGRSFELGELSSETSVPPSQLRPVLDSLIERGRVTKNVNTSSRTVYRLSVSVHEAELQ